MSKPATLDDLRRIVFAGVRRIGQSFRTPADDWTPVFLVQTPQGIESIGLDNPLFASGASKDLLGEVLRRYVALAGAYRYALLLNTHVMAGPSEEQLEAIHREELRVEQIEGAVEQLVLTLGDAEDEQLWMATISRRPSMLRKLEPWRRFDADPKFVSYSGRFTGLNEYLR